MLFVKSLAVVVWAACSVARSLPSKLKPRQDGSFTDPQYVCGDIITSVNNDGKCRVVTVTADRSGSR